ncbi:hypothetical protein MSG28_004939 [Choristoneura fumiferana]|uniref:Uncharacterized protein n=1 Tax=Choristoneura fumiferana TaxID=7141 RepID=A0ACC0JP72_CHOFU|nr:hypothetical protein MSG28_004939 [Choristoneura fumiferana]
MSSAVKPWWPSGFTWDCQAEDLVALFTVKSAAETERKVNTRKHNFKDFIEKYSPATVWDQIDLEKSKGANYTLEEETEKFNNAIDPTDELLNLKVENGDAKILMQRNGRRWMPPQRLNESTRYSKRENEQEGHLMESNHRCPWTSITQAELRMRCSTGGWGVRRDQQQQDVARAAGAARRADIPT